jgi:3-polyprenyl-4-hydroxybenzoate decarboxylase
LDALQVPTYSRYFKDIIANKYEIATLEVDHVKMSKQYSVAIANGLEKQKGPECLTIPCSVQCSAAIANGLEKQKASDA